MRATTTCTIVDEAIVLHDDPRVISVDYRSGAGLDLLILKLNNGRRKLIPREDLEGLRGATREQIANIEILGGGTGLHWSALDLDHYVPALLNDVYGTRRWMQEIGRAGGAVRSTAKRKASQANGRKGGRPKSRQAA